MPKNARDFCPSNGGAYLVFGLFVLMMASSVQADSMLAGFMNTNITTGGGGSLYIEAFTADPAITQVEMTFQGEPTGAFLTPRGNGAFGMDPMYLDPIGLVTLKELVGLRALNAAGDVLAVWPELDVRKSPPATATATPTVAATSTPEPTATDTSTPLPSPTAVPTIVGPTYWEDVYPVVMRNCSATCHITGGIAPFTLLDYNDTMPLAHAMKAAVIDRRMPPFPPDPSCNSFKDAKYLTQAEIDIISQWADNGAPEGDINNRPNIDLNQTAVNLGPPDISMEMSAEFEPGNQGDVYQCFVLDPGLTQDTFFRAIEIIPGNQRIVHHVLLYTDPNSQGPGRDANDPELGYTCFGGPKVDDTDVFGAWAPGASPIVFPNQAGFRLRAGEKFIMQVHYFPTGTIERDKSTVNLYVASNVQKEMQMQALLDTSLRIPAGASNHLIEKSINMPFSAIITHVMPHMHLVGREISVEIERVNGDSECAIHIPDWDFNWQNAYAFENPVFVNRGDRIIVRGWYDNSANNPNNPNSPPQEMRWGEETTDEMLWCGFYGMPQ